MPLDYLLEAIERLNEENKLIINELLSTVTSAEDMDYKWDTLVALVLLMLEELEEEE
jgi:hypothetical protein